jgi:hypothetical protein
MGIVNWLKKPYPFVDHAKDKWLIILSSSVFVSVFLIVFEPFDADKVTEFKAVYLAGFGGCVFVVLMLCYYVFPKLFSKFYNPELWTIGREILHLVIIISFISVLNFFYNTYVGYDIAVQKTLFEFFGITFAVGIFPLTFITFFVEQKLNKDNQTQAKTLNYSLHQSKELSASTTKITIQPDTLKTEALIMQKDDFLYATSDNNYSTIFYVDEGKVKHKLLRISLKSLDEQLSEFKDIIRCHRSYIVNKNNIENISGNARSLILQLKDCKTDIPVSRSFSKEKLI